MYTKYSDNNRWPPVTAIHIFHPRLELQLSCEFARILTSSL